MKYAASCVALALLAGHADAQVTFIGRVSNVRAQHRVHPFDGQQPQDYLESARTSAPGPWDVTLPHGYHHAEHASDAALGGVFVSDFDGWAFSEWTSSRTDQLTRLRLDQPQPVSLSLEGSSVPNSDAAVESPNITLTITNMFTHEVVFSLGRDADHRNSGLIKTWDPQTFRIPLAAGTYEVRAAADFVNTDLIAGHSYASTRLAFELDLTPPCAADFNLDGFVDFFDYDAFVTCFESGACPPGRTADANADGFVDFFDYDTYVGAFEAGC